MIEFAHCRYGTMMYLANDKWIGKSLGHYGEALESEVCLISSFVKPGDVVIDGGANMGAITVPMALMVGEEGHVHAFEPQEFIRYALCGNIALNNFYHVTVYDRPLGSTDDQILYCIDKQLKNDDGEYFYDGEEQHVGGIELTKESAVTLEAETKDPSKLPFEDRSAFEGAKEVGGSIYMAELDLTHPIAYGYQRETLPVYRNTSIFIKPSSDKYLTPIRYTENPHLGGYISKSNLDKLKQSASVVISRTGQGRVIHFFDSPNFRGTWFGTNKLFLNALFFGDKMD